MKTFSLLLIVSAPLLPTHHIFAQENFWQPTNGPYAGTVQSFVTDSMGQIFVGVADGDGGVFKSSDGGTTWYRTEMSVSAISFAVNSDNHIFAGTDGNGLFRSTDNGTRWLRLNFGSFYGVGDRQRFCDNKVLFLDH